MAFNFNWSPLTADTTFYTRARELLTTALNKNPKPPIIQDAIAVSELNLGSLPPELEILEIGDLADDRFRGIFKMSYTGDAFLTLSTRVQANPLNTYLSTRPSWTSPRTVAAATGLTIPIRITLSEIKLSAFVILVFSRQKGLTLVFRDDPLESLAVSSSFDSIPFIRDYLQRQIEKQLRNLLMEDVPAIIHRLSLRLWVPEFKARDDLIAAQDRAQEEEKLVSPPNEDGSADDESRDGPVNQVVPTFSRKNLLQLAVLAESQRTLSLFTPTIPDSIYRAWTIPPQRPRGLPGGPAHLLTQPALSRMSSHHRPQLSGISTTTSASISSYASSATDRISVASPGVPTPMHFHGTRDPRTPGRRKKKHRIVNLRKSKSQVDVQTADADHVETASTAPGSMSAGDSTAPSQPISAPPAAGFHTPLPRSPPRGEIEPGDMSIRFERPKSRRKEEVSFGEEASSPYATLRADRRARRTSMAKGGDDVAGAAQDATPLASASQPRSERPRVQPPAMGEHTKSKSLLDVDYPSIPEAKLRLGGLAERAWLMKMADEFARRGDGVAARPRPVDGRGGGGVFDDEGVEDAPPAYSSIAGKGKG